MTRDEIRELAKHLSTTLLEFTGAEFDAETVSAIKQLAAAYLALSARVEELETALGELLERAEAFYCADNGSMLQPGDAEQFRAALEAKDA